MAIVSNASRAETSSVTAGSAGTGSGTNTRPTVDVTAVTTRDDFLLELGETLSGQASVLPVESMTAALEHLSNTKRGHVLAIDTRDVTDIRAEVERAQLQAVHAVVLVFAVQEMEKEVCAAIKGSSVLAVLPIPLDKSKTGAVLEGAIADAIARKSTRTTISTADRNVSVTVEHFQPQTDSAPPSKSGGKSRTSLAIGAGVALVAAAVAAFIFLGHGKPAAAPPAPPQVATAPAASQPADINRPAPKLDTSLVKGKVDDLLEKARLAMRERRYSEPIGDNALLYYRSAAAADPASGEAADGLQRVAAVLVSRFDEAMSASRFDEASLALASFKAATPHDNRITTLEVRLMTAQINKSLADGNLDRVNQLIHQAQSFPAISADQINKWKVEATRRQEDAKIQHLAAMITERIRDGRLVDPADDSAKLYVQQLRDAAPTTATTQRLARDLNIAYLRKAREAAMANRAPDVDRWLTEARAGGMSAAEIGSFQKELSNARQKALNAEVDRLAGFARDRMHDGRLTDPAQDSAIYYITQIQSVDGSNAAVPALSHDLAGKLIERARAAAQAGKGGGAVDADLTQAKRLGADPKDILAVQQVQTASKAGAGGARSAANAAALAASLKRARYVAPEFPIKAQSQGITGSVTVEYTVDVKGDPRDVRVVEATPPGVFDRAALTAVKKWHYDPVSADGSPVEVPVRTSIRFELPK